MKAEMANQRSHAFSTATTCRAKKKYRGKKTCRAKNNKNSNQRIEILFSTDRKSAQPFAGSMSAQGNDTQCQLFCAKVSWECDK